MSAEEASVDLLTVLLANPKDLNLIQRRCSDDSIIAHEDYIGNLISIHSILGIYVGCFRLSGASGTVVMLSM